MKFNFEISRDEYADFNKFHFMKVTGKIIILTSTAAIFFILYSLNKTGIDWSTLIISLAVSLILFPLLLFRNLSNTGKKLANDSPILERRQIEFSDNGISCVANTSNSSFQWSNAKSLGVGKKAYYLYVDTNMAIIIPMRLFNSEKEKSDFEQFVASKIKTTK